MSLKDSCKNNVLRKIQTILAYLNKKMLVKYI